MSHADTLKAALRSMNEASIRHADKERIATLEAQLATARKHSVDPTDPVRLAHIAKLNQDDKDKVARIFTLEDQLAECGTLLDWILDAPDAARILILEYRRDVKRREARK